MLGRKCGKTRIVVGVVVFALAAGCSKDNTVDASQTTECGDNTLDCVPCSAGEYRCDGATMKVCQQDGQGFDAVSMCVTEALCVKGLPDKVCAPALCNPADTKCDGAKMWVCPPGQDDYVGTDCPSIESCTAGLANGKCASGECAGPTDCSGVDTACRKRTCVAGSCGFVNEPVNSPCETSRVCDGAGNCVGQCNAPTDCTGVDTECRKRSCEVGVCGFSNLPSGTPCGGSGSCDGSGACSLCTQGERKCKNPTNAQVCDGSWVDMPCNGLTSRCDHGSCVGGAPLVWIPAPGGGSYGIEVTEVTNAAYASWLATNPGTSSQPSVCFMNTTFVPVAEWPATANVAQNPVVYVDWCDALAYCKAMGKRLCGRIGGGSNDFGAYAQASKSQWFNACSSGGVNAYPYGSAYVDYHCNGGDLHQGKTLTGGAMEDCQSGISGYLGVFDLSGNVREWEDSCEASAGGGDECRLRGGSFDSFDYPGDPLRCDDGNDTSRRDDGYAINIGFRCCSDP